MDGEERNRKHDRIRILGESIHGVNEKIKKAGTETQLHVDSEIEKYESWYRENASLELLNKLRPSWMTSVPQNIANEILYWVR